LYTVLTSCSVSLICYFLSQLSTDKIKLNTHIHFFLF
jgi:hypothetical protein